MKTLNNKGRKTHVKANEISHCGVIMEKWEYKVLEVDLNMSSRGRVSMDFQKNLNLLGKDGWEMVQTISRFKNEFILFKRKKLPKK